MTARVDFFIGLFLVVFSVAAHLVANQLPEAPKGLGPGDYPKVVIKGLLVLGAVLAATAAYRMKTRTQADAKKYGPGELKQVGLLVACVALYLVLVRRLGFLLLTPFFMVAMMYLFGLRKWVRMIVIGLVTTGATWIIFNRLLLVLLPRFNLF